MLRRLICCGVLAAALGMAVGAARAEDPAAGFSAKRDEANFRYYRALFPAGAEVKNFRSSRVMSTQDAAESGTYLQGKLDGLRTEIDAQRDSVARALDAEAGLKLVSVPPGRVTLTFEDAFKPWAQTVAPDEILMSALVSRGLMLGALDEVQRGKTLSSEILRHWYLNPGDAPDLSPAEMSRRVRLLLDAIQNAKFDLRPPAMEALKSNHPDLMNLEPPTAAAAAFRERMARYSRGETVASYDAGIIVNIFDFLDQQVDPAQRFMLAHELGHIYLGHLRAFEAFGQGATIDAAQCAAARDMENAADAFAIAALVYGGNGDAEIFGRQYMILTSSTDITSDAEWFDQNYGYGLLMTYAFSEAGLNQKIRDNCSYTAASERIARISTLRKTLLVRRRAAFEKLAGYLRSDPPLFYALKPAKLDAAAEDRLYKSFADHCRPGRSQPDSRLTVAPVGTSFSYFLRCHAEPPSFDAETRLAAGNATYDSFRQIYDMGAGDPAKAMGFFPILLMISLKADYGEIKYTNGKVL